MEAENSEPWEGHERPAEEGGEPGLRWLDWLKYPPRGPSSYPGRELAVPKDYALQPEHEVGSHNH